jgi:hypothetical protein
LTSALEFFGARQAPDDPDTPILLWIASLGAGKPGDLHEIHEAAREQQRSQNTLFKRRNLG